MGQFWILESYVGERVNKIRFVGSINKENQVRVSNAFRTFGKQKERSRTREKRREGCAAISASNQVRVRFMIK